MEFFLLCSGLIIDSKGDIYRPREWFIVPIDIIEKSIKLIMNGKIIEYVYDKDMEEIIKRC